MPARPRSLLVALTVAALGACSGEKAPVPPAATQAAAPAYPTVTNARLDNATSDNGWLMYRRDYKSNGYAPFKEINTGTFETIIGTVKLEGGQNTNVWTVGQWQGNDFFGIAPTAKAGAKAPIDKPKW